MSKYIYLDNAATTPVDPEVVEAMNPFWSENFGNPSSLYGLGLKAKKELDEARQTVADFLGSNSDEIIFAPGGTGSINLALKGVIKAVEKKDKKKRHLITSSIEHHAVLHSAERLAEEGSEVSILPVNKVGLVSIQGLEKAIKKNTVLLSIMTANNEIGSIQPIKEIGMFLERLNREREKQGLGKIYFHTDACQASGTIEMKVDELKVDLLTINASKIYGPKGIGALYIRKGTPILPLLDGGGQEKGLVSGTENLPGIVGLAKAVQLAEKSREQENKRQTELRDWLISQIKKEIPKTRLNGHAKKRLPNNVNISILDIEGEALLLYLDQENIQVATGSACTADNLEPSHVIRALGCPYEVAHGSLRFTLGKYTTKKELEYLMSKLPSMVKKLREISPVKVKMREVEAKIDKFPREIKELKKNS